MPSTRVGYAVRFLGRAACGAVVLLGVATVQAAGGSVSSSVEARKTHERDVAACHAGKTHQDRATCLREAGAALQAAKAGRPENDQSQFEKNRLLRCERQPLEDRADCVRRMNGEGTTSGSVESGAIFRELVTPVNPQKRD